MTGNFERKCVKLFGYCPLNIHDLVASKVFEYSETDLLYEAAKKYCINEQRKFFTALCDWKNGKKMQLTQEEAEKRNRYFMNAQAIMDEKNSLSADRPVDWMAFPNDDPTICYYIGLPLDDELCLWAEQYK